MVKNAVYMHIQQDLPISNRVIPLLAYPNTSKTTLKYRSKQTTTGATGCTGIGLFTPILQQNKAMNIQYLEDLGYSWSDMTAKLLQDI